MAQGPGVGNGVAEAIGASAAPAPASGERSGTANVRAVDHLGGAIRGARARGLRARRWRCRGSHVPERAGLAEIGLVDGVERVADRPDGPVWIPQHALPGAPVAACGGTCYNGEPMAAGRGPPGAGGRRCCAEDHWARVLPRADRQWRDRGQVCVADRERGPAGHRCGVSAVRKGCCCARGREAIGWSEVLANAVPSH